jgi:hypothetical protein
MRGSAFGPTGPQDLKERLFWVSWRHLHAVLADRHVADENATAGSALMLRHLWELLERKRLWFFRGFPVLGGQGRPLDFSIREHRIPAGGALDRAR